MTRLVGRGLLWIGVAAVVAAVLTVIVVAVWISAHAGPATGAM